MTAACEVLRFTMFEGDSRILNFEVKDEEGNDVAVDDATAIIFAMFTADTVTEVVRVTLLSDPAITVAGNVVTVTIPANEADLVVGEYIFELQLTDATSLIHTIAQGTATVKRSYIE